MYIEMNPEVRCKASWSDGYKKYRVRLDNKLWRHSCLGREQNFHLRDPEANHLLPKITRHSPMLGSLRQNNIFSE